jgi:hypothetical protein
MNQHEWIPSENDTRRHCKYCGIYEDYTNKYPECEPQEKPVLEEAAASNNKEGENAKRD